MSMSLFKLASESFKYYFRNNLVLALGVAAATAVLTGALIVGDSMRTSLRKLAMDRLGRIDEIVVADGFFRARLADELEESDLFSANYADALPAILFPNGSVQIGGDFNSRSSSKIKRASKVNVFGVDDEFWSLSTDKDLKVEKLANRRVIINQALAEQLGISDLSNSTDKLTLRIPKPSRLPSDSALGKKNDLIESLVELDVVQILPNSSIARFGLHASQFDSANIFVPIGLLQDALSRSVLSYKAGPQANVIFLAGDESQPPSHEDSLAMLQDLRPQLDDLGLSIKEVSQMKAESDEIAFEYFSLSSDRLVIDDEIVDVVKHAFPDALPVFTYLANDICQDGQKSGIPFSMVAAIDIGESFPLKDVNGESIIQLEPHEIVINEWAAENLDVKKGDRLRIRYFEPEATHGEGVEQETFFDVKAIAKLSEPDSPFQIRRKKVVPAQFLSQTPTLANDPDLTPEVPGLTDAESIEKWDLPFATADKLGPEDDDYWNLYRTTPKAFIKLSRGQELWHSRFGNVTSFRIPKTAGKLKNVRAKLLNAIQASKKPFGFSSIPIKRNAIEASSGSTPFDGLFLALSMFVIGAALILVSLLFKLTLQRRAEQIGILLASGFERVRARNALLIEMFGVSSVGVLLGVGVGIGYAALMIFGLTTWWLGAISRPILELQVSAWVLCVGAISGLLMSLVTIIVGIRSIRKVPVRSLLAGESTIVNQSMESNQGKWRLRLPWLLLLAAIGLSIFATRLGGEPQAGAFMGAGFLVLAALLLLAYQRLNRQKNRSMSTLSLFGLASLSAKRNPLRSTLTIGLVAVASFLIVAVSSFRLAPSEQGTGGFDLMATSDQAIFDRLDESQPNIVSYSLRLKTGEDASCNNLYQSTQPQVIGVSNDFIDSFTGSDQSFRWSANIAAHSGENENPWILLKRKFRDGAIPVVIDKNTANYSLKIFAVGGDYQVNFETGETVKFRVVGFLENSILQGSLIISEDHFVDAFPSVSGYKMFLIRSLAGTDKETVGLVSSELEERYSDSGFDAQMAIERLVKFQQVQNTYISTFQSLGALGLLLGTFGLAIVQLRSVLERQQELGLMRSVGYSLAKITRLILLENVWLLLSGLLVGIGSAMVTTLPHYLVGGAAIPWLDLTILFCFIVIVGMFAAWIASRMVSRMPLIDSLRR